MLAGIFLFSLALAVTPLRAQNAQGTILGHVQDSSGASVPTAKVTVANEGTGITNTYVTGESGDFVVPNLIPGSYAITVEAPGFKAATSRGLVLQVDHTLRQDFVLEIGQVNQEVTVTATSQMVQTDNATVGEVVEDHFMQALPLNGRDFLTMIAINAGVAQPSGGNQTGNLFYQKGLDDSWRSASVNGARPTSIYFMLDGVTNTDYFFDKAIIIPAEDAIEEFKLMNGMYSAEYGMASAQVNVAIKSGTNQLHGSAYDFLRNDVFDPTNPLTTALNKQNGTSLPTKTPFKQNQFGFTLGGPVRLPMYNGKDRTFWFASYEGGRRREGTPPTSMMLPTNAELKGDFSDWPDLIYDPVTSGSVPATPDNPAGRVPFTNNSILPGEMNGIGQKLAAYFPAANVSCQMPCANFVATVTNPTTTDIVTSRLDHQLSTNDRLSGTFNLSRIIQDYPSPLPASATNVFTRARQVGLSWQHSFSANSINEAHVGYARENFHEGASTAFGPNLSAQLGFVNNTLLPAYYGIPTIFLSDGYAAPGNENNGYSEIENIFEYGDNLKLIKGKHTFTLGADIRRGQLWNADGFVADGVLNFTGSYTASDPTVARNGTAGPTAGNAFADLLLGSPLSTTAPSPIGSDLFNLRGTEWNFFFEDDYRVTPRLTLNLGLRYEFPGGPGTFHSTNNSGYTLDLKTPGMGLIWADKNFVNTVGPGSNNPEQQATYFQCCVTNSLVPGKATNFAPRIGLAWRPLPTDKFVVRAAYGLFYDRWERFEDGVYYDDNQLLTTFANPNYPQPSGFEATSPLALQSLWLPPVALNPYTSFPSPWTFRAVSHWPENKPPYSEQWSLDTQFAFSPSLLLDLGYVGARGLHEPYSQSYNEAAPPPVAGDPCNYYQDISLVPAGDPCLSDPNFVPIMARVPYKNVGAHSDADYYFFDSSYQALQARLNKRFAQGFQFMINYTWSKTLDQGSEMENFSGDFNHPQDPHHLYGDYGLSQLDQAQRLVFSYSYALPVGKGRRWSLGPANYVLGGWSHSGILTFATGLPFTVFCCNRGVDQFGDKYQQRLRADVNGDPTKNFSKSVLEWFNPNVFTTPPPGTYGNVGRDTLRAPGERQADIAFTKDTHLFGEQRTLQFRVEIFNFLSSWHTGNVFPYSRMTNSPSNCTSGASGNCLFSSLVPLNGLGELNLWTPHIIQLALKYSF